ncbi:MAG: glycosyltransferase [Hyphomicrobiales bacterium]|nr:glycosyltransferase [Hyphomicrobiales bacterium]
MALAARRWRKRFVASPGPRPAVSIVQPLCGVEPFSRQTLQSIFRIDWPQYEVLFCVQRANDPVIALAEAAIAAHPNAKARLLIGDDPISSNPKLNNCVKGWQAARHAWVVLADSNVLMPPDYLARLMAPVRTETGLVVSMPLGSAPDGFAADVECAMLNTFQARWQFAAEAVGMGFAQGKNMLWRRSVLDDAGGIGALAAEIAEDAASTKVVRAQGYEIHLVDRPFEQPLGKRTLRAVWGRHARWARLRRATFPAHFAPEILTGALPPAIAGAWAAQGFGGSAIATAAGVAALLYGAELALAVATRLPLTWRAPFAMITRDLLLPALWVDAWLVDDFTWHGQKMTVREEAR